MAKEVPTTESLMKLAGTQRAEEALRSLGVNPDEISQLQYAVWAPWNRGDAEHAEDPIAFKGKYQGYKMITKAIGNKISTFGGFIFDDATGPGGIKPKGRANGYIFFNTILLDDLGRVLPGTDMAVVWMGEKPNQHGGKTHLITANVVEGKKRASLVGPRVLPPMNQEVKLLGGRSPADLGDDDISDPSNAVPDVLTDFKK
jgi:hypothetical protein